MLFLFFDFLLLKFTVKLKRARRLDTNYGLYQVHTRKIKNKEHNKLEGGHVVHSRRVPVMLTLNNKGSQFHNHHLLPIYHNHHKHQSSD